MLSRGFRCALRVQCLVRINIVHRRRKLLLGARLHADELTLEVHTLSPLFLEGSLDAAKCIVCVRERGGFALNVRRERGCARGVLCLARGCARALALELQRQLGAVLREM